MTDNPLVAAPVNLSTPFSGAFLLEDGEALADAIKSGDWVAGGMAAFSFAADTVAAVLDPLGSLIAAGLGWVMEHIEPLKGWLNDLTGDAGEVAGFAQTWANISTQLANSGQELLRVVGDLDASDGEAIAAYRRFQNDAAQHIQAAGSWADAMNVGMQIASTIVKIVHDVVRDAIAQVVGSVISYAATLVVSLGTATPYVIAQATSRVASLSTRVGSMVTKLLTSGKQLMKLLDKLGDLFRKFDGTLTGMLPGARTAPSPHAPDVGGPPKPPDGSGPPGPPPKDPDAPGDSGGDAPGDAPDSPLAPELSQQDIDALRDYTGPGYQDMNQALRGQTDMTPEVQQRIDRVSGALDQLPDHSGTVYRGETRSADDVAQLMLLKKGDDMEFPAFTSTSTSPDSAFQGNVRYEIDSSHGKDVQSWSLFPNENEILLDQGSRFTVSDVIHDNGNVIIRMTEK